MRRLRRAILLTLINGLLILLATEGFLRLADPWGINRYYDDFTVLYFASTVRAGNLYNVQPGRYNLAGWTATVLPDYTRRLPASGQGACRLVFIGDSVTWGYGVSDDQTFANRIAAALPHVTARNAAFSGYNSAQVRALLDEYAADLYVYLIIANDPATLTDDQAGLHVAESAMGSAALRRYWLYLAGAFAGQHPSDWPRFWRDLAALHQTGRVIFFAFDDGTFGSTVAARYPVHLIPPYREPNSRFDGHPSASSHAQIAAAMLPAIRAAVQQRCPTEVIRAD